MVEMGSHPTKRFLFNHTTPFSTKGLEKSLCDFTGTIFVQCENPVRHLHPRFRPHRSTRKKTTAPAAREKCDVSISQCESHPRAVRLSVLDGEVEIVRPARVSIDEKLDDRLATCQDVNTKKHFTAKKVIDH